eukprot:gene7595-11918_t
MEPNNYSCCCCLNEDCLGDYFGFVVCEDWDEKCCCCSDKCGEIENKMDDAMNSLCDCDFELQNFPWICLSLCLVGCCILPIVLISFIFLISLAIYLVLCCPPLAIIVSALPCLRSKNYEVFSQFESKPENRADPSQQGHVTKWYEIGWIRALILCCFLTMFGFFPGVIFASYIGIYHVIRFWSH